MFMTTSNNKSDGFVSKPSDLYGRGDRIRTCGPLLPKQMRYQTALRLVISFFYFLCLVHLWAALLALLRFPNLFCAES